MPSMPSTMSVGSGLSCKAFVSENSFSLISLSFDGGRDFSIFSFSDSMFIFFKKFSPYFCWSSTLILDICFLKVSLFRSCLIFENSLVKGF